MSLQLSKNITDTPVSGVSSLDVSCPVINYGKDYAVVSSNADEATLVNLTTGASTTEKVLVKRASVANVYSNTSIDQSYQAPTKRGVSVVFQINSVYTVTDTADSGYRVDLPVQAHIVLKMPSNDLVTDSVILDAAKRCVSTLFDTGSTGSARILRVFRGSLLPSDMK